MRSNEHPQRALMIRQLGGVKSISIAFATAESTPNMLGDLRLFALTFASGFLFTTIFIA